MTAHDPPTLGTSVLVAVDGSPEARDAALLGRTLAEAAGGALRLVTAADQVLAEVAAIRSRIDTERLHRGQLEAARVSVRSSLAPDFRAGEVDALLAVRLGRPEHVIGEVAGEVGADVIVLGGRRHGTPAAWFERGTAHHLLRVRSTPLVVTGPGGAGIERVVAAVDLSYASEPTVRTAARIAALLSAPLEVVHVVSPVAPPSALELPLDAEAITRAHLDHAERTLAGLAPTEATWSVVRGDVLRTLAETAGTRPTLLVLGAQGRGWVDRLILGSTTEAVLSRLPCSLAIVPVHPEPSTATARGE